MSGEKCAEKRAYSSSLGNWRKLVRQLVAGYSSHRLGSEKNRGHLEKRQQRNCRPIHDYRHGSQRKDLTLSALEFIRRFSLHILPPGLVRIRHYGILGNNRRRRDIEAARAIFKRRGCAVEFQPQSLVDPPCGGTCCPLCGKAGIRLVAFIDATGLLHMMGAGPRPCDSS